MEKEIQYEDRGLKNLDGKDCIVSSLWYGLNYGSIVSAFALYKVLEKMGKNPVFLNKPKELWTSHYDDPDNIAGKFIYKNCEVASRELQHSEMEKCSLYVTGPDVVWNYDICGKETNAFFYGKGLKKEIKRISCAASFGKVQGTKMTGTEQLVLRRELEAFSGISVRNGYDAGACDQLFGIQPEIILDPIFLCDTEEYEKVIRTAHYDATEPYICTYIERGNKRIRDYIEEGMRIKNHPSRTYIDINRFEESSKELGMKSTFHVMADDWLCSLWNSDFVVTDSYYCVCLAILFHKPFAVITSPDFKKINDIHELLSWFDLEERIVPCDDYSDMKDYTYLFRKPVNYGRADEKLRKMKEDSMEWIRKKLAE